MKKLLILFLLPFTSSAQENYQVMLDHFMQAQTSVNNFNGNVLIAKSGSIIYEKSFGYSNYNTKEQLDNNSMFELASVSKQFTAMGILILKDRGKLKLSDSLRQFFPELPYTNITIQNLLTHTSGLPDYMDAMATKWNHNKIAFNEDVIKFLAAEKIPPNFTPSAKWEYSNTGYEMLASIIEKVSGVTYSEFMQKNIFTPLGMNRSRVYNTRRSSKEIIPDYAYGFVYSDSLKRYILPDSLAATDLVIYLDGIVGDGCINSTTEDLLKWNNGLKNHTLLDSATQKEMLSAQSIMDTTYKKYYGYGVMLGKNEIGNYITHSGGWPGYHTLLTRYVDDDITIIVLSNNESNSSMLAGALAYIVTNRDVVAPYKHVMVPIDTSLLSRYAGEYLLPGFLTPVKLELKQKEGKLYCHFEKATVDLELKPESTTKFFYDNHGANWQIEFETDASKKVVKAFFIANCLKKEITKIE